VPPSVELAISRLLGNLNTGPLCPFAEKVVRLAGIVDLTEVALKIVKEDKNKMWAWTKVNKIKATKMKCTRQHMNVVEKDISCHLEIDVGLSHAKLRC
jgi:hypothetical protein